MWGYLRSLFVLSAFLLAVAPVASADPDQDHHHDRYSHRDHAEGHSHRHGAGRHTEETAEPQSDRLVLPPQARAPERVPPIRQQAEKTPAPKTLPGNR